MTTIISPCIKLCAIDAATGLCAGCGRSLDEIGAWLSYSDAERRKIIDALPRRRREFEAALAIVVEAKR
jgi:predicted Fe-S protein YdhL (DUF1289 family)